MKHSKPRLVLDPKAEQILRAVYFYRFMGALDVCTLLYSKGALTRVRDTLARLSGGADYVTREYLYRFPAPGRGKPGAYLYAWKPRTRFSGKRDRASGELVFPA